MNGMYAFAEIRFQYPEAMQPWNPFLPLPTATSPLGFARADFCVEDLQGSGARKAFGFKQQTGFGVHELVDGWKHVQCYCASLLCVEKQAWHGFLADLAALAF